MKNVLLSADSAISLFSVCLLYTSFDYFDVEEEVDATTVNGWVVLQIDKLPEVGDQFVYEADYKRFDVVVTKADERKALEINMTVEELSDEE